MRRTLRSLLILMALLIFLGSAYSLLAYLVEDSHQREAFEALGKLASAEPSSAEPPSTGEEKTILPAYAELYEKNPHLFGWIRIEGTRINYPVMFVPEDAEYYLYRNFDRKDSAAGAPFIDGNCFEDCGNYLIHGHNMKTGAMFGSLADYRKQEHWEKHPLIRFDTLYEEGLYEILGAFRSKIYHDDTEDGFRYYEYTDLTEETRFEEFVREVKEAALYDTGATASFGDELITLATCAYHENDGRFVVVARRLTAEEAAKRLAELESPSH